jgi:histidyl-tRNA synthetase
MRVAGVLRAAGVRVFVYPEAGKIGKQMKYADDRQIPFIAIVGSNEIGSGTVTLKNLVTGAQETVPEGEAGPKIREGLKQRG